MRVIHTGVPLLCTAAAIFAVCPASAADDSFGAIAYSVASGRSATAHSWTSTDEARQLALADCNRDAPAKDCFIAVYFQNACGAVAADFHGNWGAWWKGQSQPGGYGLSAALEATRSRAVQECRRHAGAHAAECRVVADRCAVAFNL
jgi:hypothetical protein